MEKSRKNCNLLNYIVTFAVCVLFTLLFPMTAQAAQHIEGEKYRL